jgi:hypothetical protein
MLMSLLKTARASVLAAGLFGAAMGLLNRGVHAEETPAPAGAKPLIDADFSRGDFAALGWKALGDWDVFTHPPATGFGE